MKYKKGLMLFMIVAVLMGTAVLPGCNKEQPVEANKLVIPSFMTSYEVFNETANAGPYIYILPFPYQDIWVAEYMIPEAMPQGALEEQFVEGYYAAATELYYLKRDGKQVGYGEYTVVLWVAVLKYENVGSGERSFINISKTQQLQDSTYRGIALKKGTYSLGEFWKEAAAWRESTVPCYVIHSGCFVIYFYGREDVLNDMLDRIIAAFGVKE